MAANIEQVDKKSKFDLAKPSDPPVTYTDVRTTLMNIDSVDDFKAAYTDENPAGSRTILAVHGFPGNHL